jgi:type IV secretion system protein VirD4
VTDTRRSASLPHHFSGSGGSRTIAEVERPLLDPAEVGALPDDEQLVFIAGHRPYRLPKLKYDELDWMAQRAAMPPHRQADKLMTPERPAHPWAGISPAGFGNPADYLTFEDRAELRRIQVEIERDERVAAARAAHRAANQAGKEAGTEANRGAEDHFGDQDPGPAPAGPLFQRPDAAARASEQGEPSVQAMNMPSDQPANGPSDGPANGPAKSPAPESANNSGAGPAPRPASKAARGGARASRTSGEAADARTLLDLMHKGEA